MQDRYLTVRTRWLIRRVPFDEILYLRSEDRKLRVETPSESYLYYARFREVEPLLDGRFLTVLRGCAVNLDRLTAVEGNRAAFSGGKELRLSRDAAARLKREFLRYLEGEKTPLSEQKMVAESAEGFYNIGTESDSKGDNENERLYERV